MIEKEKREITPAQSQKERTVDILTAATEVISRMPKKTVELVKNTVAKGASDRELALFLYLSHRYGLDPLLNEIYFAKMRDPKTGIRRPVFIVSRDGYLKVAMRNPDFQGLTSGVVREGDEFEIDSTKGVVKHKFGSERGKIIGAWARGVRKGFDPFIAFVDFEEYYRPNSLSWQKFPSAMIQKVAEVFVLRRLYNLSGITSLEESESMGVDAEPIVERGKVIEAEVKKSEKKVP